MWRKSSILALGLALVAAPAIWAQGSLGIASVADIAACSDTNNAGIAGVPFGSFDGIVTGGNSGGGVIPIFGWALDDDGVASVDILVNGTVVERAAYGAKRPDVAMLYPDLPSSLESGFMAELDSTRFLNGVHAVGARVTSNTGEVANLNTVHMQFTNTSHTLAPFGSIDFPNDRAELFGTCDPGDPERRYSVVSGWALDAGVEINDHGLGYVELLLDGVILANSRRDCFHSSITGAYTNCYGIRRNDIGIIYPELKDSPYAGFRFVVDVGQLMALGWVPGQHTFKIRAGDQDSQVADIDSIVVTFACDDFFENEGSFGEISWTQAGFATGVEQIDGWALDREGVEEIRVLVDGRLIGTAAYGFAVPEVSSQYPGFPDSDLPGWVINLDTTQFSNGQHDLGIVVVDSEGEVTLIGELGVLIRNL